MLDRGRCVAAAVQGGSRIDSTVRPYSDVDPKRTLNSLSPLGGKEVDMASDVVVRSVPGERFTQEVETGRHKLLGDEPESDGGSDLGPGPYEYLLAALGT